MTFIPKPHEIYKHFKGDLYQIVTVAEHSETGEQLVVYQAMYGDFKIYARPLSMFISKVDRMKYPKAAQEFRFQLQGPESARQKEEMKAQESGGRVREDAHWKRAGEDRKGAASKIAGGIDPDEGQENSGGVRAAAERENTEIVLPAIDREKAGGVRAGNRQEYQMQPEENRIQPEEQESAGLEPEELNLDPMVLEFLDADSYEERLNILAGLHHRITGDMITTMAIACDVEVPEGEVEERYESLRSCLLTRDRYECSRLR